MPNFKKSDGFKMKRGSKPTFKDLGSNKDSDSPAKSFWDDNKSLAVKAAPIAGAALGGVGGGIVGSAIQRQLDGTAADEKKFAAQLEEEGLTRGFWGKLGFGGRKARERAARIEELKAQEQSGIDRDRIYAREGTIAGPGS